MSSGPFINSKYESSELGGAIMRIRLQEETLVFAAGVANAAPAGAITIPLFAIVSGTRREFGVKPRKIVVSWIDAAPEGYDEDSLLTIPVLTVAAYNAYTPGTTGTYLGQGILIERRICETAK